MAAAKGRRRWEAARERGTPPHSDANAGVRGGSALGKSPGLAGTD